MTTVTLNEMDLQAFVTAFNSIAEVADYRFDAETEYRLAIANLVGALKEQLAPAREMISITPRVALAAVLEEKYRAWDAECASGALCQSAADLVGEYLDKADCDRRQFAGGVDAGEAVAQLRTLLAAASAEAWDRYELALCAATRQELEVLKLSDLLGALVVADSGRMAGSSFWGRRKKP
jgi:hypothetical protein